MAVLNEDLHSLGQREAIRNRRADRIVGWAALAALALTIAGTWAGVL